MIHPDGFASNAAFRFNGEPVIDTTKPLFYYGNSQGGIAGGALTAIATDFTRSVLYVPGMNYSTLLTRSIDFEEYSLVLYPSYPDESSRPLLLSLIQSMWDRGEPNGYANHMTTDPLPGTPEHKVLIEMAYGDHQVANVQTEVEARTIGAPLRVPAVDANRLQPGYDAPFVGLHTLGDLSGPAAQGSGFFIWDIGPKRRTDDAGSRRHPRHRPAAADQHGPGRQLRPRPARSGDPQHARDPGADRELHRRERVDHGSVRSEPLLRGELGRSTPVGPRNPPNLLLLITDQQRQPRHWPDEPGWIDALMPNSAELARTGLTFRNGFCNASMCSPSRATLFTGRYPAEHGVELTLTAADLRPDPRNVPAVVGEMAGVMRRREAPVQRVLTQFGKSALRIDSSTGHETELPATVPNLPRLLRERGYEVAYKGKWHLTHPLGGEGSSLGGWSERDSERIARDYGFADWEAPDAGENARAENFGGGIAGEGEGWDEVYTRQIESWLGRAELPEPFCLVASLVNPHDVLGYPASHVIGGYSNDEFRDLGVLLPPSVDENLNGKPSVHALMRMGMTAYLGPLRTRRSQLDYVNFYAYLHRVIDDKIGRILTALGSPGDPGSLRSRTVVVRCLRPR